MSAKRMIALVLASLVISASAANAASTPANVADAQAVNTACASDAVATNCTGKVVGKGLIKCMGTYKKANPTFKTSPACQTAIEKLKADKKAGK